MKLILLKFANWLREWCDLQPYDLGDLKGCGL